MLFYSCQWMHPLWVCVCVRVHVCAYCTVFMCVQLHRPSPSISRRDSGGTGRQRYQAWHRTPIRGPIVSSAMISHTERKMEEVCGGRSVMLTAAVLTVGLECTAEYINTHTAETHEVEAQSPLCNRTAYLLNSHWSVFVDIEPNNCLSMWLLN